MAYNQKFGPNRKGSKHGKDMISRIMSGADTAMSPLDNSVQYLKGMSGAMNGQKGMDGYSYGVPAEKLKGIQGSEGMSRYEKDGMSRYEKGGMSRHTAEHSTEEYMDRKDAAIKKSKANEGMSRHKAGHAQGYNDKLDESLGSKDGKESTKKQSRKSRRDESEGMEKTEGKRKFSSDKGMDKKEGGKKIPKGKSKAKSRKFPTGINPKANKPGKSTAGSSSKPTAESKAKKKAFDKELLASRAAYYKKHGSSSGGSDKEFKSHQAELENIRKKYR